MVLTLIAGQTYLYLSVSIVLLLDNNKLFVRLHGENAHSLDQASSVHKMLRIETIAPRNLETIRIK
jgi:predicted metal-dependent RNase